MLSRAKDPTPSVDYEGARQYAFSLLEHGLITELHYHSAAHTCTDVVLAVERLAKLEGVTGQDLILLKTAACYHDLGFLDVKGTTPEDNRRREQHEARSVEFAQEILPRFGYNPAQLQVICDMIRATRIPQSPHTLLEKILADADLDSLGREDFWERSFALRKELDCFGMTFTEKEWYIGQLNFQKTHRYFTNAARQLRDAGKERYIKEILQWLADVRV